VEGCRQGIGCLAKAILRELNRDPPPAIRLSQPYRVEVALPLWVLTQRRARGGPVVFDVIYRRRGDYLVGNFDALGAERGNHDPRAANDTQGDSIDVP
jgi:hypothetical protein